MGIQPNFSTVALDDPLHTASPMPVPDYFSRVCKRWKIAKILSAYWGR